MELDTYQWGRFDISWFGGIFYHLPLPMTALRNVANMTNELMYINTASRRSVGRQGLVMAREDTAPAMNGIHGLNWYPTDPKVMIAILEQLGFVEFHIVFNRQVIHYNRQRGVKAYIRGLAAGSGRFALLASKKPGLLADCEIDGTAF